MAASHHRKYLAFQRRSEPLAEWTEVYEVLDHHVTNLKAAVGGDWSMHGPLHDADALTTALIRREGVPLQLSVSLPFLRGHGRRTFPKMPDPLSFEFCLSYLEGDGGPRRPGPSRRIQQLLLFLDLFVIGGATLLMTLLAWQESGGDVGLATLAFVVALIAFIGVRVAVANAAQRLLLALRKPVSARNPPAAFLALIGPVERYLHDSRSAFMRVQRAKG
jgi:hypothetical protein